MADEAAAPVTQEAHSEPPPSTTDSHSVSCPDVPGSPGDPKVEAAVTAESPPSSPTEPLSSSMLDSATEAEDSNEAASSDRDCSKSESGTPQEDTDPDEDTSQPASTPKINIMFESSDACLADESETGIDVEEAGDEYQDDEDEVDDGQDLTGADLLDSDLACNNLESDEESPELEGVAVNDVTKGESEVDKLLKRRMQPIHELVYSEQSYVKRLTIIKDKYMTCLEEGTAEVPEDLANKWRILWGNWLQLYEWHSAFLEKLERLVVDDPDQIPKLFIDYRARLRNIYSKYCENHRKAALIAEQYKEFFDELRVKVADKEDVVSHLMQPVQRIMRYQLPMGEIVKYTDRANLPSIGQWRKALDIMKEIPKDTQLILEAARIDGFPGVITSLGNMRIRGELLMAITTKSEQNQPNFNGSELKFVERRLFLFDQMLLFTEEAKPKRKDPFAQSSYQFKHALNVNKMKFESHWVFANDEDEDIKFVITEESTGKEAVYILDPGSVAVRERWVIQLRDLQNMQRDLLLALQDPKRFAAGGGGGGHGGGGSGGVPSPGNSGGGGLLGALRSGHTVKEKSHHLSVDRTNSESGAAGKKKKQKWPSFSKKGRSRTEEIHLGKEQLKAAQQGHYGSSERLSAPVDGASLMRKESLSTTTSDSDPNSSAIKHHDLRKSPGNCQAKEDSGGPGTSTAGTGKKKSLFSNLFGKNKH